MFTSPDDPPYLRSAEGGQMTDAAEGGRLADAEGGRLASARRTPDGSHEMTIQPGADVADVAAALDTIPIDSIFTVHFGDVEVVLVFRPIPPATPALTCPDTPEGPDGPDDGLASADLPELVAV